MHLKLNASGPKDDRIMFVDISELSHLAFAEKARAHAEAAGRHCVRREGSTRLPRCLIHGERNDEDLLVLQPGRKIGGVCHGDTIVKAEGEK